MQVFLHVIRVTYSSNEFLLYIVTHSEYVSSNIITPYKLDTVIASASLCISIVLLNINFKQFNWSVFIISALRAHNAYFDIITCWAAKIHTEPWWSVGTSAACAFMTALLSIP